MGYRDKTCEHGELAAQPVNRMRSTLESLTGPCPSEQEAIQLTEERSGLGPATEPGHRTLRRANQVPGSAVGPCRCHLPTSSIGHCGSVESRADGPEAVLLPRTRMWEAQLLP